MSKKIYENNFLRIYNTSDVERWYSIAIASRNDDSIHANFTLIGFGKHLSLDLPSWIMPPIMVTHEFTDKGVKKSYEMAEVREYGISLFEDGWRLRYGLQSGDSSTEKSIGGTIPWLAWRFVRHDVYDTNHNFFASLAKECTKTHYKYIYIDHKERDEIIKLLPKIQFAFKDFDGEEGIATCYIEEREWRFGEKWCWWLSFFRKPKIRRELDISYSIEVGKRKGSWKGGTIGTGCDLAKGQNPEEAFKKHCEAHNLTFIKQLE